MRLILNHPPNHLRKMIMELITRLVYIDTSAYERKHFQFGLYILEKLENLDRKSVV